MIPRTEPKVILEDFNLEATERRLCILALEEAGTISDAANLLGITRHALKRRIIKLGIDWPRDRSGHERVARS